MEIGALPFLTDAFGDADLHLAQEQLMGPVFRRSSHRRAMLGSDQFQLLSPLYFGALRRRSSVSPVT